MGNKLSAFVYGGGLFILIDELPEFRRVAFALGGITGACLVVNYDLLYART